eukprot:scaffold9311_cov17-Tisochrysis_lutea.AAC.1
MEDAALDTLHSKRRALFQSPVLHNRLNTTAMLPVPSPLESAQGHLLASMAAAGDMIQSDWLSTAYAAAHHSSFFCAW